MPSLRAYKAGLKARSRFAFKSRVKRARSSSGMTFRRKGFRAILQKYNVHSYRRWGSALDNDAIPAGGAGAAITRQFTLSGIQNFTEFTQLYDQYKITGVKVRFQLLTNPDANNLIVSTATSNANNFFPKIWYVRDYDNTSTEGISDLRQRNNVQCKVMRPNSFVTVFIKPAVRNQIYLDGVTTASTNMWNQWIDCTDTSVPHYGLKYCYDFNGITTVQPYYFRVEVLYYVKFKNCR